jgi:hypothetical protein
MICLYFYDFSTGFWKRSDGMVGIICLVNSIAIYSVILFSFNSKCLIYGQFIWKYVCPCELVDSGWLVWFMVFKATFNNISVISWRQVLLVEETGVCGENHRPVASHWQTLSHNVVSSAPRHELPTSVVTGTDCSGSCKSNYHTITTPSKRHEKDMKRKVTVDSVGYHV